MISEVFQRTRKWLSGGIDRPSLPSEGMPSYKRNLGKVSYTWKDAGTYGEFINSSRVGAWRYAIENFEIDTARILDVGCSYGSWFENWKTLGFREVAGVDPNPSVIEQARARYDEVRCVYVSQLPEFYSEERAIAANGVLVHILKPEETVTFLRDVATCLSRDGHFAYAVVNAEYYLSAGRREWVGPNSCVRLLGTHRRYAREAGLNIIAEVGTFIDPWAMRDLEFLASYQDMRNDPRLYRPFLDLAELLRGNSTVPFSEVLFVTKRA